jgi:hypothetical protein
VLSIAEAENIANRRHGLLIGLGGCWGFRGEIGKTVDEKGQRVPEKGVLPDFDRVTWQGRDTFIVFDANTRTNPKVRAARRTLAAELTKRGARVRVVDLPAEDGVNGPDDYIGKHGAEAFFRLIDSAVEKADAADEDEDEKAPRDSQATLLVRMAREAGADLFHHDGTPCVTVTVGSHTETYRLRSKQARAWLSGLFLDALDKAPGGQAIADALNTLEALAARGENRPVYVRIAESNGRIYLDIGDATWRCIEITQVSWRVIDAAPVRFRRPKGLLPLAVPQPGGSVAKLRPFVNVATETDFVLVVATVLAFLRGRGPYPLLVENGEQGSSKSTLTKIIKQLIDPNEAPLGSAPREVRDLMIAASHSHLLGFDNLSVIPDWLSDALCSLSTESGFSTQSLFTDEEETIFSASRPMVMNGIPAFASRQDLVGRSVIVTMPPIPDSARRDEQSFWAEFERERPFILGALLDIIVVALRNIDTVVLERLPRMADFAKWIVAAGPPCPWLAGTFMAAYDANRHDAMDQSLDGDALAEHIKTISTEWSGTAADLLTVLNAVTEDRIRHQKSWFQKPRQIADHLRRIAPALRQAGWNVDFKRAPHTGRRVVYITNTGGMGLDSSPSSPSSQPLKTLTIQGDAAGDECQAASPHSSATSSPVFANKNGLRDDGDAGDAALHSSTNGSRTWL